MARSRPAPDLHRRRPEALPQQVNRKREGRVLSVLPSARNRGEFRRGGKDAGYSSPRHGITQTVKLGILPAKPF